MGEVPDRPEKRGAIPRDLHRLKKWAGNSPVHEYLLGDIQLEGSSAEKDLVVLVGPKMKMTQRSALAVKKATGILDNIQLRKMACLA